MPTRNACPLLACTACLLGVLVGPPSYAGSFLERSLLNPAPGDSTLFSVLVRHVRDEGLWAPPSRTPAFDPRAVDSLQNAFTITKQDLAPLSEDRLQARRQILDRLGVPQTDILADVHCAFTGGLPAIDSTGQPRSKSAQCEEKGAFTSVIFGTAHVTSDCTGESRKAKQCATVRAIESTEYSFFEYKLILEHQPDQGWAVTRKQKISGAAS